MKDLESKVTAVIEEIYNCKITDTYDYIDSLGIGCPFSLCYELGAKFKFYERIDGDELHELSTVDEVFQFVRDHV